jgi:hypothetical protein
MAETRMFIIARPKPAAYLIDIDPLIIYRKYGMFSRV